jgi:hypothetical protein
VPPGLGTRLRRLAPRIALGLVGLAVGAVLVSLLREATLSTHDEVIAPDSQIELVVAAHDRNAETGQTLPEMVEAQILTCRLEVASDMEGEVEPVGLGTGNQYRAVLTPSMDETNRRQFRGCVEDWVIDGVQLDVLRLEPLD